jgi:hypothetical protein
MAKLLQDINNLLCLFYVRDVSLRLMNFDVENYMKVFHHYNFKVRMKMLGSVEWTEELYFGEVKEIFGRKFYFCCPLEPNESGNISFVINEI